METIQVTPIFDWLLHESKRINFLYGSAGSGKSYQVAIYLIKKLFEEDNITILVTRKTTPSLRLTAYKLVLEILAKYFPDKYEVNKTEMIITRGNSEMIFKGLDDPAKIRSLDLNYAWLEEATEFTKEDYEQILLRIRKPNKNNINQVILTTNPISIFHWTYTDIYLNPDPSIAKHKSLWSDNPFLDKTYINELQKLQGNYRKIFVDGEFGLLEGLIFPNFTIYENVFDTVKEYVYGADFGYTNAATLMKIMFLETGKFIADELIYESGLTNTEFTNRIIDLLPGSDRYTPIYCDSAEPDRIQELYNAGLNAQKARKDVNAGIDYMIENMLGVTARSINTIRELRMYSWAVDKDNRILPKPLAVNDHAISAIRYGSFTHSRIIDSVSEMLPFTLR